MSSISCPKCQASVATSDKKCPECGTEIVVFNGQEWSTMTRGEQLRTYGLFALMSTGVAWLIVTLMAWLIGDLSLSSLSHDMVYYGAITLIALAIYRSTTKALKGGEMNS